MADAGPPRWCIVHLAGLSDWLLHPEVDSRRLPFFQSLFEEGFSCKLACPSPLLTPANELSLLTGHRPHQHGVFLHETLDEAGKRVPARADNVRLPVIWECLAEAGLRSISVGWPVVAPATYGVNEAFFNPQAETASPSNPLSDLVMDISEVGDDLLQSLIPQIAEVPRSHSQPIAARLALADLFSRQSVSTALLKTAPEWHSAWLNYPFLDILSGALLPFVKPAMAGVTPMEAELYGDVYYRALKLLDSCLQGLAALLPDDTRIVVVSSYSLARGEARPRKPSHRQWEHAAWHNGTGILLAKGPGILRDQSASIQELCSFPTTVLTGSGLNLPDLFGKTIPMFEQVLPRLPDDEARMAKPLPDIPIAEEEEDALDLEFQMRSFQARSLMDAGAWVAAAQALHKLLERFPEAEEQQLWRVGALSKVGLLDQAITEASDMVHRSQNPAHWMLLLGELHFEAGNYDIACSWFEEIQVDEARDANWLSRLGLAKIRLGQTAEARQAFQSACEQDNQNGFAHMGLGYCTYIEGNLSDARAWTESGLGNCPDYYLGWWLLARISEAQGDPRSALNEAQQALALDPPFPSLLLEYLADLCMKLPDASELVSAYRMQAFTYQNEESAMRKRILAQVCET